jgi:hypothetical protein
VDDLVKFFNGRLHHNCSRLEDIGDLQLRGVEQNQTQTAVIFFASLSFNNEQSKYARDSAKVTKGPPVSFGRIFCPTFPIVRFSQGIKDQLDNVQPRA